MFGGPLLPVVGKARADVADPQDGQFVHLYKDRSVAGLITQRRRLMSVMEVLDGIARNGLSLARRVRCVGQIWLLTLIWGSSYLLYMCALLAFQVQ